MSGGADRIALVTGTGGLGFETALALTRAGLEVIMVARNPDRGELAAARIASAVPGARIRFEELDLADLASIEGFASRLLERLSGISILVANAGVLAPAARMTTRDGFELQFGVNYLGHFALIARLMPLLLHRDTSRIVSVTSMAHKHVRLDLDDPQSERKYSTGLAYARSKLAQAVFARELQRRSEAADWGIVSVAAHPGVARTAILDPGTGARRSPSAIGTGILAAVAGQSAAAGAAPIIHAALAPDIEGGQLYGPTGIFELRGAPGRATYAPHTDDVGLGKELWQLSEALTETVFPAPTRACGKRWSRRSLPIR